MLSVRPLIFADIPHCISISKSIRQESYLRFEQPFYNQKLLEEELALYSTETFAKFVSDSDKLGLVAESDRRVAGLAIGKFAGAGLFDLSWICSSADYRRKGVGRQLLNATEAECRNKNCHKMFAYTFPWLVQTIDFYKSCGFKQEAVLKQHWHRLDFVLMSKFLTY
jgi:GNAT superfamily N-acetyltransferase